MGGPWAVVGNVYKSANWTVIPQAGMCTRVAHVVSATLLQYNCARYYGRDGAWGFCAATDGTVARSWCDGFSVVCSFAAHVRFVCDHGRDGRACMGHGGSAQPRTGRLRVHGTTISGRLFVVACTSVSSATTDGTVGYA